MKLSEILSFLEKENFDYKIEKENETIYILIPEEFDVEEVIVFLDDNGLSCMYEENEAFENEINLCSTECEDGELIPNNT